VPTSAVEDHDGMGVRQQSECELGEEPTHRMVRDLRQHQTDISPRGEFNRGEQTGAVVTLIDQAG
jgi:hypothetical protein